MNPGACLKTTRYCTCQDLERPNSCTFTFNLRPYLISLETRWRVGGDSSLHWLQRRLRDVSWRLAGSLGSRGKCKHVRFGGGGGTFSSLQQVSETSPSVAATSQRLILSATGETSPRPAGDQEDWGDVAATSPRLPGELVVTLTRDVSKTSWRRLGRRLGESTSHFLVSRVAATD